MENAETLKIKIMRNRQTWEDKILPKVLQKLPPRVQKELSEYEFKKCELKSYYIWGEIGTGKTLYANHLYVEAHKQSYLDGGRLDVLFYKMYEIINKLKDTFSDYKQYREIMDRLMTVDVLIIDDFGSSKESEWLIDTIYQIIDYRYEYQKVTIITSNGSLNDISRIFGDDRIPRRIEAMCEIIHKIPKK